MKEMTDEEVFGRAAGPAPRAGTPIEMSDEEVFGAPAKPSAPLNDDQVFSTPERAGYPGVSRAYTGIGDVVSEYAKGVARGVKGNVASALQGVAGWQADRPSYAEGTSPLDLAMRGDDEAFRAYTDTVATAPPIPTVEHPLYRAGEALSTAGDSWLAPKKMPAGTRNIVGDVGSGVGSVAGTIGLSMLNPIAATLSVIASGAGESTERAVKAGATPEQIARASRWGTVSGATDVVDVLLPSLGSTGKAVGFIAKVGIPAIKGAFAEGGQEGLQQFIQNMIAQQIYKPDQDLKEDVGYNALVGFLVGGSVAPAFRKDSDTAPTQEELRNAFTGLSGSVPPPDTPPPPGPSAPAMPAAGTSDIETLLGNPPEDVQAAVTPATIDVPPPTETPATPPESPTAPPLEPTEILPPLPKETPPNHIPADVVAFLAKKNPRLGPEAEDANARATPEQLAAAREEIDANPGAEVGRMARLVGAKLYGTPEDLPDVTIKEILQNSFDAIKTEIEGGRIEKGHISINTDSAKRVIQVYDNGEGMAPDVLGNQFLRIAGTKKATDRASGGLGLAKMLFLYENGGLDVRTMRNGKVARLVTTGPELFRRLEDPQAPKLKIQISEPTAAERKVFKDGHGTMIQVTIPEGYVDPSTGEAKKIDFPVGAHYHKVLMNSPLFNNIDVTYNGQLLNGLYPDGTPSRYAPAIGAHFPLDQYTSFANIKLAWGTAHIYVTKEENALRSWEDNAHVLSNGIWQFSFKLKKDPNAWDSEPIKKTFYIDVDSAVKPEDPGYPFDLNRQGFTKNVKDDFENIFNYMSMLYRHEDLSNDVTNFGTMHYLHIDPKGSLSKSNKVTVEPKAPKTKTPANMIRPGDTVTVKDGRLIVNGRKIPTLTPALMAKFTPNVSELKVPQSEINPNRVMVHDNVIVKLSDVEAKPLTVLGQEKFGARFDQFLFEIGEAFREIRTVVADAMHKEFPTSGYLDLKKEGIGVSFDKEYRGVSIKIPFSGMFINPAIPEFGDPLRGAVGMVGTMVHELAHFQVRSHNKDFPAEMQRMLIMLNTHPTFDYLAFQQKVVLSVAQNKDIFDYINGLFSGTYVLESSGKRFKEAGENEARDASLPGTAAPAVNEVGGPTRLRGQLGFSKESAAAGPGRAESDFRIAEERAVDILAEKRENTAAVRKDGSDPGLVGEAGQEETRSAKAAVDKLFQAAPSTPVPPVVAAAAAHADKMTKMFAWGWGLDRLVDRNMHFTPLLRYAERIREMRLDASKIQDAALRIAKSWRSLGAQSENLSAFIDDIANMTYRTPDEVKRGIVRHPTQQEFDALVSKHQVGANALAVFDKQKKFFHGFLQLVMQNAMDAAARTISDPVALAKKLDAIRAQGKTLTKKPYFPFIRYGNHFITVRDATGNVVYFQTVERQGLKAAERVQTARADQLRRAAGPGHTVEVGVLPDSSMPFTGLPPVLLEAIAEQLGLTPAQKDAMDQLRYEHTPAASFQHRLQHKDYTPGYSHDFLRSFSRYAFHGSRYYARTKYAWALNGEIAAARKLPGNKAGAIANYMQDHLTNTVLDAKGDFGIFKGFIFMMTFGFSVAGATLNLSQVPMITFPFLAAKFGGIGVGDARATKALAKAMGNINNFYKKGHYTNQTEFEMRAIDYGIQTSRITESQAAELAGFAQGNNLLGMGNSKFGRDMQEILEKGAWFFEMAEQYNRRVTYRAALDLAVKHPNSIGVQEAMQKYADEYTQLATQFTPAEAQAIVAAIHAVEQTQFVYARETRPRFMRGSLAGTVFVFKTYMINVLQLLGANKSSVLPRFAIMSLLASGLMGLPGAEDLEDIANMLGKIFFGKDFRVKLKLREHLVEALGDKADIALHGLARRGFGLAALADMIGEAPGRGLSSKHSNNVPFPVLDRSKSLGMGRILPFELGKLIDPGKDVEKVMAEQTQRASGAILSVGFNLYKALQDNKNDLSDLKRWEKVMPRALSAASSAYRAFDEGRERTRGGVNSASTVIPYDIRDTEHMAEIIARGLGYMPLRQSARWDSIIAEQEMKAKLQVEQRIILDQWFEAKMGGKPEELVRMREATKQYNESLPEFARGYKLSNDSIQHSLQGKINDKIHKEAGIPVQRRDVPVARHIQSMFPESVVDVRKVK